VRVWLHLFVGRRVSIFVKPPLITLPFPPSPGHLPVSDRATSLHLLLMLNGLFEYFAGVNRVCAKLSVAQLAHCVQFTCIKCALSLQLHYGRVHTIKTALTTIPDGYSVPWSITSLPHQRMDPLPCTTMYTPLSHQYQSLVRSPVHSIPYILYATK
jgi:hypothetical protein